MSYGRACFSAVTQAGCSHQAIIVGARKPRNAPEFLWVNTVLGNLKTSLQGCYHSFAFRMHATRCLCALAYRFNRRFDLRILSARLLIAAACCPPQPQRTILVAEASCQSD